MVQLGNRFLVKSLAIAADTLKAYAIISVNSDPVTESSQESIDIQSIYVRQLGIKLSQQGHQVDIFTRRESIAQPEIVEIAPRCRIIRLSAGPFEVIPKTELFNYLPEFVESFKKHYRESRRTYSLIHTNYWLSGWVGLKLKEQLGIPQIHTNHSLADFKYSQNEDIPLHLPVRLITEQEIVEQVECVIARSYQEKSALRRLVSKQGRIKIIPFGIDTNYYASVGQTMARQRLGIALDKPIFLYVGGCESKGFEILVNACARLPQSFQLYVISPNPASCDCKAKVKAKGLEKVIMFKQIAETELLYYLAAASVCILPYYESSNNLAVEAMAAGAPVIASNVAAFKDIVLPDKTGMLVTRGNSQALADALFDVIENPLRWRSLGYSARKWVRDHYSYEAIAQQIHQLYETIID